MDLAAEQKKAAATGQMGLFGAISCGQTNQETNELCLSTYS